MVEAHPLPGDLYADSLEEYLLFRCLCVLHGQQISGALPPALSMATRNDLYMEAHQRLWPEHLESFVQYAEQLSRSMGSWPSPYLPPPDWTDVRAPPRAEIWARQFLEEGQCSLWSAVRQVISQLDFEAPRHHFMSQDNRARSFSLGIYARPAVVGLCRATMPHPNVCKLLCRLVSHVCPSHRWTTIAVHVNYSAPPHIDSLNGPQSSLLMSLSLNDEGGLWVQDSEGQQYYEHNNQMLRGTVHSLQDQYLLLRSHEARHAVQSWIHYNRVTLVAYTVRQWTRLVLPMRKTLLDLGFNLPDPPLGQAHPPLSMLPTIAA